MKTYAIFLTCPDATTIDPQAVIDRAVGNFVGTIDGVVIYNRQLSHAEAVAISRPSPVFKVTIGRQPEFENMQERCKYILSWLGITPRQCSENLRMFCAGHGDLRVSTADAIIAKLEK